MKPKIPTKLTQDIQTFLNKQKNITYSDEMDKDKLLEELFIFQAELEAQNNELQERMNEIETLYAQREKLFHVTPVAIILLDQNLRLYSFNRQAQELFSWKAAFLHKPLFVTYLDHQSKVGFLDYIDQIKEDDQCTFEARIWISNSEQRYVVLHGTRVQGLDKGKIYFQFAIEDITEHKKQKKRLEERILEEIEKQKIQEVALQQQNLMLSQAMLLKDIAHHWRNPLNILVMYLENIKQDMLDQNMNETTFETIDKGISELFRLSTCIKEFAGLSKPNETLVEFELDSLINKIQNAVTPMIQASLIEFSITHNISDTHMQGYPNALAQVVISLIHNAVESIEKRKDRDKSHRGIIECIFRENNTKIQVIIRDNGTGIPEEIYHRIFQPYVSGSRLTPGSGLSLYHARNVIVYHMQGDIDIHNKKDEGVEILFSLPKHLQQDL